MGDIVRFENDMNKLKFGNCTKTSLNLFMALCYFIKNNGTKKIVLTFDEIQQYSAYKPTSKQRFIEDLRKMSQQLREVNSEIIERNADGHIRICSFNLFPTSVIDPQSRTFEVSVNEEFAWLFNEFNHYTSFDLHEIISFKSKYSKNLFRLLKQWRSVGRMEIRGQEAIAEFRDKIGVKPTYGSNHMMYRCIYPAIEEINELSHSINGLECTVEYAEQRGAPIDVITFTWTESDEGEADLLPPSDDRAYIAGLLADIPGCDAKTTDIVLDEYVKAGLDRSALKDRIDYARAQEGIDNMPGYIISLIRSYREGGGMQTGNRRKKNSFHNFTERRIDLEDVQRRLLMKSRRMQEASSGGAPDGSEREKSE